MSALSNALRSCVCLVAFGAAGGSQAGFVSRFQIGAWNGGVFADDRTGEFRNCGLSLKLSGGTDITVVVPGNFNVSFVVADPRIAASPQQRFEAVMTFDQGVEQRTPALALSATMAQIAAPAFPNFYDGVRASKRLTLTLPGLTTTLDVSGLDKVLPRLFECALTERAKMALPASAPEPGLPQDKTEAGLLGLAAAEKSGVGPYVVFADKDRPPHFERPVSVWGHPQTPGPDGPANVLGFTYWHPPQPGDTPDNRRVVRKDVLRKGCAQPQVEVGDLPPVAGRAQIVGVYLACGATYEEAYMIQRRNGGYFEVSLSGPPNRRKTVEGVGARYRAAFGAILP